MKKKTMIKIITFATAFALLLECGPTPTYAAQDPLTVINNLSDFVFALIRAIGIILLGFGITITLIKLQGILSKYPILAIEK